MANTAKANRNGPATRKTSTSALVTSVASQPASAKSVLKKDGEYVLDRDGAKASIQFAEHLGSWVAEFRFSLRCGRCWACTLPLTTASSHFPDQAAAVSDAARRLLDSLASAIDGDRVTKPQQKSVDALIEWASMHLEPLPAPSPSPLAGKRFLDLFAGIGGFHLALAAQGAVCAGAVEIDPKARETYRDNHKGTYPLHGDIRTATAAMFGRVDIVCGGFPCQSFSVAGDRAGFDDASKGALFFEVARLIGELAPTVAILENVAGLCSHDGGRTFDTIMDTLADLGYSVGAKVLNASDFGLPQMRARLFLVCIHDSAMANRTAPFAFPAGADATKVIDDILEAKSGMPRCDRPMERTPACPLSRADGILTIGRIDGKDSQGYRVASSKGKGFTLCANSGGPGSKTGLYMVKRTVRKLSARECARMQGFPESFRPHPSPSEAARQFGNSVAVPVVEAIARSVRVASRGAQAAPVRPRPIPNSTDSGRWKGPPDSDSSSTTFPQAQRNINR